MRMDMGPPPKRGRSPQSCTKCKAKPSVYFRPYSGERLCAGCFSESIRERVERTIARFDMVDFDSRIAVGVSGGKDSLNLLHILADIEGRYPRAELVAVTIDEGIKRYRDEALGFVREASGRLGVELLTLSFKELFGITLDEIMEKSNDRELTPCAYCGVLRRRALNEAARRVDADRLATAHNLDDMAQTALLNMLRGDLRRFAAMHPAGVGLQGFVRRIKPYCEVPERESAMLAYLRGLEFQSVPCPYAGEAMRNDARNFLIEMEAKRPGTQFIVLRTSLDLISSIPEKFVEPDGVCKSCGEPTTGDRCRVCQLLEDLI